MRIGPRGRAQALSEELPNMDKSTSSPIGLLTVNKGKALASELMHKPTQSRVERAFSGKEGENTKQSDFFLD